MSEAAACADNMLGLVDSGVRLSLDDFGKSYFFSPRVSAAEIEPLLERDRIMDVRVAFPAA